MEEAKKGHRFKHSKAAKQKARRCRRRQEVVSPVFGERSATKDENSNIPCMSTPASDSSTSRPDHHSHKEDDNIHDVEEERFFRPKKLQFENVSQSVLFSEEHIVTLCITV